MFRASYLRTFNLFFSVVLGLAAAWLFIRSVSPDGYNGVDFFRTLLVFISTWWLSWGAAGGLLGLFYRPRTYQMIESASAPEGLTAILVPIYNEDPAATFSRIAAMDKGLRDLGVEDRFHFAVLSDSTSEDIASDEVRWMEKLLRHTNGSGRIFYRRRTVNTGKKAGNVEDFFRRSGGAYDYALILDADSLMEGTTILEMARRMEDDPELGLLQTLPKIIKARSVFGRVMQFSASYFSPVFAGGATLLQGHEGPFWGHNAMVRVQAFAASCGLPELEGKAPFGGHILSHDYVEAALLARAGWKVQLQPDLGGSFEEGPENLIEYAKRDRRWCQGNLQHHRLVSAPGLRLWSRFVFVQGIMAYLSSPLWLMFLVANVAAASMQQRLPLYLRERLGDSSWAAWTLIVSIFAILILPKVLIVVRGAFTGANKAAGGNLRVAASVVLEIVFTSLLAPVMLLLQSRSVAQVIFGLDGGWPSTSRDASRLDLKDSWAASYWIVIIAFATLATTMTVAPTAVVWILPIIVPMALAPLVISWSSYSSRPDAQPYLFATTQELAPAPVIAERDRIFALWTHSPTVIVPLRTTLDAAIAAPADV